MQRLPAGIFLALAVLLPTAAYAASNGYCVTWAIRASANATTIKQVDQRWAWCLNQDMDPPLVDGVVVVPDRPVAKAAPSVSAAGPSCRRYRSFDPKTKTILGYDRRRKACN